MPSLVNEKGRFFRNSWIIWKGMIGKELLGYQNEGFIFLGGYQIQRRDPLVIQDSQLAPKYVELASAKAAKAWISFI